MGAEKIAVFFYGLFMDESLLAAQGIRPSDPEIGHVDGFRLRIGQRASLLPEPSARAYGMLMSLAPADLASLYSGHGLADYVAEPVTVTVADGRQVRAACYNLPAARLAGTNPDYAAALLALASRLGLPDSYLRQIRTAARPPDPAQDT